MSIQKVTRRSGNKRAYRVAYRDHADKQCAETYSSKTDAESRDSEIKQAKQRREPIPKRGRGDQKETFEAFARNVWWAQHASQLTRKTQKGYAQLLDKKLIPRIGDEPISYIDVARCLELRSELAADGVPGYSASRALKLLRQVLAHAVLIQRLPFNPADVFGQRGQLPSQKRKSPMRPLWPADTEAIRAGILARAKNSPHALRDATFISVMAFAGLRPQEALALTWGHVGANTIKVERANVDGKIGPTKTGEQRTVSRLIAPLMADLDEWRAASPDAGANALVFAGEAGQLWTEAAYKSWTKRVFKAQTDHRVYDLRDGYACLLAREGVTTTEAAMRMGHSEAVHLESYRRVFVEYRDEPTISMEALVKQARKKSTKSQHSMGDQRKPARRPKLAAAA